MTSASPNPDDVRSDLESVQVPMRTETALMGFTSGGIELRTFEDAVRFCKTLADSGMLPERKVAGKVVPWTWQLVFARVQMGAELRISPMQSIWSVYDVHGRPALGTELAWAIVLRDDPPEWGPRVEWKGEGDTLECTVRVKPRGREVIERSFGIADAKKAGLYGDGSMYKKWPKRLPYQRAFGFCLKDGWPHVLRGMAIQHDDDREPERNITQRSRELEPQRETPGPDPLGEVLKLGAGAAPLTFDLPARELELVEREEVSSGSGGADASASSSGALDPEREQVAGGKVPAPVTPPKAPGGEGSFESPERQVPSSGSSPEAPLPDDPAEEGPDETATESAGATASAASEPSSAAPFDPNREPCPECGRGAMHLREAGHGVDCSLSSILPDREPEPLPASLTDAIRKRVNQLGLVETAARRARGDLEQLVRAAREAGGKEVVIAQTIMNWRPAKPRK